MNFAGTDVEGNVLEGLHAAEGDIDVVKRQQWLAAIRHAFDPRHSDIPVRQIF
jgi:hypothetical protein